jgi:hypothetical protein
MTIDLPCVSTSQRSDSRLVQTLLDETRRRFQTEK